MAGEPGPDYPLEQEPVAPGAPPVRRPRRGLLARLGALGVVLGALGPGLVTANAGNDSGGIATYASVGAQYGYSLLWAFPLILVGLALVQEMAARMGAATGKGLSDLIRENFPLRLTALVLLALLVANGLTVITEFIGIAASIDLVFPSPVKFVGLPLIAFALWVTVIKGSYRSVERIFLTMTLAFFAYPMSAFLAHPKWGDAVRNTVIPSVQLNQGYLLMFVALVGTSITPYMQVYVQSAVADKGITARDYKPERIEVYLASVFANLVAAFIVIATAASLHVHGITQINTADDAARALSPLAGSAAKYLFAIGLFGASMLAAAVLPLATAYAITEALGLEKGLDLDFGEAPIFMGLFTGLIALGVLIALIIPRGTVIQVLIFVQVIDCLLLPFVLFSILRLVNDRTLMGNMVNGPVYNAVARTVAALVTALSLALLVTTLLPTVGLG